MNISKVPVLAFLKVSAKGINTGKICNVIGPDLNQENYWIVEFPHPIEWTSGRIGFKGPVNDSWLCEIKGDDESLETETTQPIDERIP